MAIRRSAASIVRLMKGGAQRVGSTTLETAISACGPFMCCAAGAGSTRDQALYSAKLALISAILYVIAAIAM